MPGLILQKLLDAIPTVFLVLTLVFIVLRILPGDPALVALGDQATPEQLQLFREQAGLNVPIWEQYFSFLWNVVTFNFGRSIISGSYVIDIIGRNLPYTIELTIAATIMGALIAIPVGVIAAVNRNTGTDQGIRVFSLVGMTVPDFYLAALLLIAFALNLGWFPINGGGEGFIDRMYHLVLPVATLTVAKVAGLGRLTRTSVLEVLNKDYVRTARAKGAPERQVIFKHALRNAMMPITTSLGMGVLGSLSGSIAIEMVFNRPGVGQMLINAINERDYPTIQGGVIVFTAFVVLINLAIDIIYLFVDPRLRRA